MEGMRINRYMITLLASLSVVATGMAQTSAHNDTINRMVLVESTYNPVVAGALKRNFIPEESEPVMKSETIVYADESIPISRFERIPQHAEAVQPYSEKGRPGYVHLGYGSHNNLNGLAAYQWAINNNNGLALDARIDGWNGNIRREDDTRWRSYLYDMDLGARYSLKLGKAALDVDVNAARYAFNYLTNSDYDATLGFTESQLAGKVSAGIHLRGSLKEHYYYRVRSSYTDYSQQYYWGCANKNGEVHSHTEAMLGVDLYEWGMPSVTLRGDWMAYHGLADYRNYLSLGIAPQWNYVRGDFDFVVGANFDFMTRIGSAVQASPNLKASYTPGKFFSADVIVDGGRSLPTFGALHSMSPYWTTDVQLIPSYTFLNARIAGNVRVMEGFHVRLGGGFKMIDNALFQMDSDSVGIVYTGIVNHDANVAFADVHMNYAYKDLFRISAEGTFSHWMVRADRAVLARAPRLDVNVSSQVRIIPGLHVHTDCRIVQFTGDEERAIVNWSLGARYAMNDRLSFFLDGHNLLNRRYQHYSGYPSQGINVLAGAVFKF